MPYAFNFYSYDGSSLSSWGLSNDTSEKLKCSSFLDFKFLEYEPASRPLGLSENSSVRDSPQKFAAKVVHHGTMNVG